jgi:hypothetical protein
MDFIAISLVRLCDSRGWLGNSPSHNFVLLTRTLGEVWCQTPMALPSWILIFQPLLPYLLCIIPANFFNNWWWSLPALPELSHAWGCLLHT